MKIKLVKKWTYGAEHELGDWDKRKVPPKGVIIDTKDVTVMNSNGIAADPSGKSYKFGGEFQTEPTDTAAGQVEILRGLKACYLPNLVVNHRSNLHIHIRVPGLKDNLKLLKMLAKYNVENYEVLNLIEPIPYPSCLEYPIEEDFEGAVKRYKRRCVSHHTVTTKKRLNLQLSSTTIPEFFKAEVPIGPGGRPLWHLSARCAVNIRQLMETDTIEFRHFPGTLDEDEFLTTLEWCKDYLNAALSTREPAVALYKRLYKNRKFPKFEKYIHWMEVRYRATCYHGVLSRSQIEDNIKLILTGKFIEAGGGSKKPIRRLF